MEEHSLQNEDQLLQSTDSVPEGLLADENRYSPANVVERQSEWMLGLLAILSSIGLAVIFQRAYLTDWWSLFFVYSSLCGLSIGMFVFWNHLSLRTIDWYITSGHVTLPARR